MISGATFILGINLAVAGLLAAAFGAVALYDKTRTSARWMVASYVTGMAYLAVEFAIPHVGDPRLMVVCSFGLLLAAMVLLNAGIAREYGVEVPWRTLAALFLLSVAAVYLVQVLPRHSFVRMMAYQLPYALMQIVAAWLVWSARGRRGLLDRMLLCLLAVGAAQFLSKPFLAHALGGWGTNPQAYLDSNYAMVSQSMGTVITFAIALLLMTVLVSRILDDATRKSETDPLSGLLNRGGFERQAEQALKAAERLHVPAALVISDLDHFKAINDNFGHAAGDQVIQAFARFLSEATSGHHIAGRIGGEEFAVMLPGSNLAAARLFAEGARSAFSALPVAGMPADSRFTASFGVAELARGETVSELMRRADSALYEAKKDGRDCVRVSHALRPSWQEAARG